MGRARLAKGDFAGVADFFRVAGPMASDDARKKALEDLRKDVRAAAEKALAEADAAFKAGKYSPAVTTWLALSGAFPDQDYGKTAKARLEAAEKDKDAAAAVAEAKASMLLDRLTALIEQCRKAGKTGTDAEVVVAMPAAAKAQAMGLLNTLAKTYPGTSAGKKAKEILEKVQPTTQPASAPA